MGAVIGLPVAYLIQRLFARNEGKLVAVKEFIAHLYVHFLRRQSKRRFDLYKAYDDENLYRNQVKIPKEEYEFEYPRKNIDFSHTSDTIQFCGVNSKKESCYIRFSKTSENTADILLHLKLADGKHYTLPNRQEVKIPRVGTDCFAGGGLRIQCQIPMRRWRISFNGILRQEENNVSENIHVKFVFFWLTTSSIYDWKEDSSPKSIANYLAKQSWNSHYLPYENETLKYLDYYEQSGNTKGLFINNGVEREIYFWGTRRRGVEYHDLNSPTHLLDYYACFKDGLICHIGYMKFPHRESVLKLGYLLYSSGVYEPIDDFETEFPNFNDENGAITVQDAKLSFYEKKEMKTMKSGMPAYSFKFEDTKCPPSVTVMCLSEINFDGDLCLAIITSQFKSYKEDRGIFKAGPIISQIPRDSLVMSIKDLNGDDVGIAGGKGASLAQLNLIEGNNNTFFVPKGLVVTTSAYSSFLKSSSIAIKSISLLEDNVSGKITGDVEDNCTRTVSAIGGEELPNEIKDALKKKLEEIFPDSLQSAKFAVRSSATGEDSEELSAAGQMDTYLGIQSFKQITKAIVKCWASQFAYTAVQYKKQNGQVLNSPMAVVVQEMVDADTAGVLFTCDPVTGNPQTMTITANYGIGESVVSASSEPDTIIVKKGDNGKLSVSDILVGKKATKTVMSEENGTREEQVLLSDAEKCCLNETQSVFLAEIAQKIESAYGCPTDIEWALKGEKVHLLQARPITTFDNAMEFDIMHGVDTGLPSEEEYLTTANIGEILPGTVSPLSVGFQYIASEKHVNMISKYYPRFSLGRPYFSSFYVSHGHHLFINLVNFIMVSHKDESPVIMNPHILAMFGRPIHDGVLARLAAKRTRQSPSSYRLVLLVKIFQVLLYSLLKQCTDNDEIKSDLHIQLDDCESSLNIFDAILRQRRGSQNMYAEHFNWSANSSLLNTIILYILKADSRKWDDNVFSDFSTLMSNCQNVISADVPHAIQELSLSIAKHIEPTEFSSMKPEEALSWMNNSAVGKELQQFLQKHGHRCYKELDLCVKPWSLDPIGLVKILQGMVGNVADSNKNLYNSDDFDQLKQNISWIQKFLLKIILPFARRSVSRREQSKSLLVKAIHSARLAFLRLGKKMVEENRLPDEELIFFLQIPELEKLLETRSPTLVQAAIRRRVIYQKVNECHFPEFMRGIPKPISQEEEQYTYESSLSLKGTPVSQGIARGFARVARTLDEAKNIQKGEILIARCTDIGWTPYFPLLAGLVTEIGGLISHGAVVAREYGLPCVVNIHTATSKFKTGDKLFLDGNKGIVQRID